MELRSYKKIPFIWLLIATITTARPTSNSATCGSNPAQASDADLTFPITTAEGPITEDYVCMWTLTATATNKISVWLVQDSGASDEACIFVSSTEPTEDAQGEKLCLKTASGKFTSTGDKAYVQIKKTGKQSLASFDVHYQAVASEPPPSPGLSTNHKNCGSNPAQASDADLTFPITTAEGPITEDYVCMWTLTATATNKISVWLVQDSGASDEACIFVSSTEPTEDAQGEKLCLKTASGKFTSTGDKAQVKPYRIWCSFGGLLPTFCSQ